MPQDVLVFRTSSCYLNYGNKSRHKWHDVKYVDSTGLSHASCQWHDQTVYLDAWYQLIPDQRPLTSNQETGSVAKGATSKPFVLHSVSFPSLHLYLQSSFLATQGISLCLSLLFWTCHIKTGNDQIAKHPYNHVFVSLTFMFSDWFWEKLFFLCFSHT